jgi:hypothetical protein
LIWPLTVKENVYIVWEDYQIDNYDIFIKKLMLMAIFFGPTTFGFNTSGTADQKIRQ